MPTIDPELLRPLSQISDILLKRPGKVSIEGIKRLSNIYGFETFTDTLAADGVEQGAERSLVFTIGSHAGTPESAVQGHIVDRLSLSGKILLIDIDFQEGKVHNVSVSSAINLQEINGETYDFLGGWKDFEPVEKVLLWNLQRSTLDAFNKNLRILSQFDRLSHAAPNDLFNFFNELTHNLVNVQQYERDHIKVATGSSLTKSEIVQDMDRGCAGLGQILMNQQDKIGLFLKIWEDDRFVSKYLQEHSQIQTTESLSPYLIHFKITESFHEETATLDEEEDADDDGEAAKTTAVQPPTKVEWFENGQWLINSNDTMIQSNLSLLTLELCPSIWIPSDLLLELGMTDYQVRSAENDYFNNNQERSGMDDTLLDGFYSEINQNGSATLQFTDTEKKLRIAVLTGCPMVKIFKAALPTLDRLRDFVCGLRTWCLVNSLLRKLLEAGTVTPEHVRTASGATETGPAGSATGTGYDGNKWTRTEIAAEDREFTRRGSSDMGGAVTGFGNIEDLRLDDLLKEAESTGSDIDGKISTVTISRISSSYVSLIIGTGQELHIRDDLVLATTGAAKHAAQYIAHAEQMQDI